MKPTSLRPSRRVLAAVTAVTTLAGLGAWGAQTASAAPRVPAALAAAATTACAPAWSAATVYTGGTAASYQGVNYTAKWWTQGETPGASAYGAWASNGACGASTPTATTTPTSTTTPTATTSPTATASPTTSPTATPTGGTTSPATDEACRPDGLYETPGVAVPYCDVYGTDGREKLPNDLKRRVIGYYTSWRTGADGTPSYLPGNIPWDKVSHINYAFAHIDGNGKVSVNQDAKGNPATDATFPGTTMNAKLPYTGELNLLNTAKAAHPGVKSLVSVGGWAETGGYFDASGARVASGGFYAMTASQQKIDAFADSAVAFIRQYGFDGVDIDYEYPTSNTNAGNPLDFPTANAQRGVLWKNYLALMKTLRTKLDQASAADGRYYELTAAVPASGWLLRGEEVSQMVEYLDFVNMMSYDLHGAWNDKVGGNAPLFDDGQDAELAGAGVYTAYKGIGYLNGDWAYHYFRGAMQAGRINLGVPFYTRGWKNVTGGTNGLHGTAPLPDQTKCPAGTGPSAGGTTPCGNGADGIDNLWHDANASGNQEAAGSNPIWHVLNLAKGVVGDYAASYGSPTTPLTGTYQHNFDSTSGTEWWWNASTKTFLSGDADQAVDQKAAYVDANGLGGIMIWELAGDYAYDSAKGQYGMGSTLVTKIHDAFTKATPYGASKADVTMPDKALDLDVSYSDFALGDNNYPINPKVTFTNKGKAAIPAGSTITFDYASSDTGAMSEQNGWGLTQTGSTKPANNVGGLKFDFYTATIKVPSGGIPAGGSASTKLSWQLPIAQLSNLRVTVNGTTYAATYDNPRGVTVVDAASGTGSTGGTGGTGGTGTCTAPAWDAATVYTGGQTVSYGGHTWSAKWWTQNNQPSASDASPWADKGAC